MPALLRPYRRVNNQTHMTTENTNNTLETFSQTENAKQVNETARSKKESTAVSESEYETDSDFEPGTDDEIEIAILDSDFEQKTKIAKENPSSLMGKVKELLSFARFLLFMITFVQTILQFDVDF